MNQKKEAGVRWGQVGNNRKREKKYYFNKKVCIIDKLMWVFCKNDGIKQKKIVLHYNNKNNNINLYI